MSWDTTVSNLNPYVWLKMDAGFANYGSSGPFLGSSGTTPVGVGVSNYSGDPIVYYTSGGRTGGAYIEFPTTGSNQLKWFGRDASGIWQSITSKTCSFAVWIKTTNVTTSSGIYPYLLSSGDQDLTGALSFIIPGSNDTNNAGKLVYNANTGSGTGQTFTGGGIPGSLNATIDGNWHLLGTVIDGNTIYWYYDGVNVGQSNFTGSNFFPSQHHLNFGGGYKGYMDDYVMFSYALTQSQMAELYNSTIPSAPLKYFDGTNWVTPQDALVWNGQNFNSTFGHQVWNGSTWLNIIP